MPWERKLSASKNKWYYFNRDTGEKKWEVEGEGGNEASSSVPAPSSTIEEAPLPEGWVEAYSKSKGRPYWFHQVMKKSVWQRPKGCAEEDSGAGDPSMPSAKRARVEISSSSSSSSSSSLSTTGGNKVAIIVPFRDLHAEQKRKEHLNTFWPHMKSFLKGSHYTVYIVEQSNDGRKFNRGKLLNIGFDVARKDGCNIFVFHDVDLLPSSELRSAYVEVPTTGPCHIARLWNRYNDNKDYFGGIVAFTQPHFESINGFPNNFWGWGGEDDEMMLRVKEVSLKPWCPTTGFIRDLENMDLQEKLSFLRQRREQKCQIKREVLDAHATSWKTNGLQGLTYKLLRRSFLDGGGIDGGCVVNLLVDVQLNGKDWTNKHAALPTP